MIKRVSGVSVVHWNPRRNYLPYPIKRFKIGPRVNNFGDLLGPLIVERIVSKDFVQGATSATKKRLLSVGSIMALASDDDVVWGTGVNGKATDRSHKFSRLDVRAVRGPLTRSFLAERGVDVPEVFGDPALLLPILFPEWRKHLQEKTRRIGIVPNFHDLTRVAGRAGVISPIGSPERIIMEILRSEVVLASSLHGIIIAEAFGVPVVPLASGAELAFKYDDYFEGTGRSGVKLFTDLDQAEQLARSPHDALEDAWDPSDLLRSFPRDLWRSLEPA